LFALPVKNRRYYLAFRKIRSYFKYYLKWSNRKSAGINNYFNKLISKTSYINIDLFRLRKIYYMCLSQMKSRINVEQLKFEVSIKKRIAALLMHWRKLIKGSLIIYNHTPNRWNKY